MDVLTGCHSSSLYFHITKVAMVFSFSCVLFLQIAGIRFMWENIIQSVRNVKSGDKGLGCILAHTMGLGKTFQVSSSVSLPFFLSCGFGSFGF